MAAHKGLNQDGDKSEEGTLRDREIKLYDIAKVCYCSSVSSLDSDVKVAECEMKDIEMCFMIKV